MSTFVPHIQWSSNYLAAFVGILGTTISPYLFFWQASQEVEEERKEGRRTVREREGATVESLRKSRTDVLTGMLFSNLVMYFIILTTAATLHAHGQTSIETAQQAAEALKPVAGNFAYMLFTLGLIGTGMLGVPVLAGAAAYAIAEARVWRGTLEDKPRLAKKFYAVVAVSMLLGLSLNYAGVHAVEDVVPGGRLKRRPCAAVDRPGCALDQQQKGDGQASQSACAQVARLGDGGDHVGGGDRNVCDNVMSHLRRFSDASLLRFFRLSLAFLSRLAGRRQGICTLLALLGFCFFHSGVVAVVGSLYRLHVQIMADLHRLFVCLRSCHRCWYRCAESQRQRQCCGC